MKHTNDANTNGDAKPENTAAPAESVNGGGEGIPFLITSEMKAALAEIGFTPEQIHKMTPAAAWEALGWQPGTKDICSEEFTPLPDPTIADTGQPDRRKGMEGSTVKVVVPVDLWGRFDPPPLPYDLLPATIAKFAAEQSKLIGVDHDGVLCARDEMAGWLAPRRAGYRGARGQWRRAA
jgi:hypothetical protein